MIKKVRKREKENKIENKLQVIGLNLIISIITLNVNRPNISIKNKSVWLDKKIKTHLYAA